MPSMIIRSLRVVLAASAVAVLGAACDSEVPRDLVGPSGRATGTEDAAGRCISGIGDNRDVPGRIAFIRERGSTYYSIYTARPDGSDEKLVHRFENEDGLSSLGRPVFAPDGRRIVFAVIRSTGGGTVRYFVVDASGGRPTRFTALGSKDFLPSFSPDGRCLGFQRAGSIWTTFADGHGRPTRLTKGPHDETPVWSPDGRTIAFTSVHRGGKGSLDDSSDVATVSADGRGAITVVSEGFLDGTPSWSPDGRTIAFERILEDETGQICTVPAAGGDARTVVAESYPEPRGPVFTPDGERIIYRIYDLLEPGNEEFGGDFELYSVTLRGTDRRHVTDNEEPMNESGVSVVGAG